MQAPDPGYAQRTRDSFARQNAMTTLGATLESVAPGRVLISMTHHPALTQQHGFIHAGMLAAALDSACGYAGFTLMPADAGVLTIEFKINLLAPARGPLFHLVGQVAKAGRTISVVDGQAFEFASAGAPGKLIATMSATLMAVSGRDDVRH